MPFTQASSSAGLLVEEVIEQELEEAWPNGLNIFEAEIFSSCSKKETTEPNVKPRGSGRRKRGSDTYKTLEANIAGDRVLL